MSELLERVKAFAIDAHKDQRYGSEPYEFHLMKTVDVLNEFGFNDETDQIEGWLHDVLEDNKSIKPDDILSLGVSEESLKTVEAVTQEPGKNRKERNAKTYLKIKIILKAIRLKLADRLANVRHGL